MYIFSQGQILQANSLYIPHAMRALLGIHDQRIVYVSDLSRETAQFQDQILLSVVPLAKRHDIWNLTACFNQRPDIVARLTTLLSSLSIDILNCTTAVRSQNRELEVSIDLEASRYTSKFDYESATRVKFPRIWLQELHARIVCEFIEDIVFRPDGKPFIYLKRNTVLASSVDQATFSEAYQIQHGFVDIPPKLLDEIRNQFIKYYPDIPRPSTMLGRPRAMLAVDPVSRYLLCYIFFTNTGHIHVRVNTNNSTSTIARLATWLSERGLDILFLNSRDLYAGDRTLIDFFLHLPHEKDELKKDTSLRKWIRTILRFKALSDLHCAITFPQMISAADIEADTGRLS